MEIDDAEHYTPEQRQAIIDAYPEHEREARTKGIPSLGSGRVFPIPRMRSSAMPLRSLRTGSRSTEWISGGTTRSLRRATHVDKDNDIWYVCASYREAKATPPIHVPAVKPWGDWIPWARAVD